MPHNLHAQRRPELWGLLDYFLNAIHPSAEKPSLEIIPISDQVKYMPFVVLNCDFNCYIKARCRRTLLRPANRRMSSSLWVRHLWGKLAILLQRGNAAILANSVPDFPAPVIEGKYWDHCRWAHWASALDPPGHSSWLHRWQVLWKRCFIRANLSHRKISVSPKRQGLSCTTSTLNCGVYWCPFSISLWYFTLAVYLLFHK